LKVGGALIARPLMTGYKSPSHNNN